MVRLKFLIFIYFYHFILDIYKLFLSLGNICIYNIIELLLTSFHMINDYTLIIFHHYFTIIENIIIWISLYMVLQTLYYVYEVIDIHENLLSFKIFLENN